MQCMFDVLDEAQPAGPAAGEQLSGCMCGNAFPSEQGNSLKACLVFRAGTDNIPESGEGFLESGQRFRPGHAVGPE